MSNQYLSFDVTKQSTPQQLITGRQGDSQLKFVSVLLWDGEKSLPYDLTGKQIAFEALKPDGTHIVDYAGVTILDAQHGLFRYSFNEQVFAVAGTMQQAFFKITHTDKDDQVIADSTLEINIHILENRVEFGINSTDYLSKYDDLIAQVKRKFDDYAATVQDSIDKANALHDQIVEYTNLINAKGVVLTETFGDVSGIKQPIGKNFVEKLNNEFENHSLNVKWFGAKGDGITDDTLAIQEAIDAASNFKWDTDIRTSRANMAPSSTNTIYFPAGKYRITKTILLAPFIKMVGNSRVGFYNNDQTTIIADFDDINGSILDTAPYDESGERQLNAIVKAADWDAYKTTGCPGFEINGLSFKPASGRKIKIGLNRAGAMQSLINNVSFENGDGELFSGIRTTCTWGGGITFSHFINTMYNLENYGDVTQDIQGYNYLTIKGTKPSDFATDFPTTSLVNTSANIYLRYSDVHLYSNICEGGEAGIKASYSTKVRDINNYYEKISKYIYLLHSVSADLAPKWVMCKEATLAYAFGTEFLNIDLRAASYLTIAKSIQADSFNTKINISGLTGFSDFNRKLNYLDATTKDGTNIYVSSTGDDLNTGYSTKYPVKTLQGAIDRLVTNSVNNIILTDGDTINTKYKYEDDLNVTTKRVNIAKLNIKAANQANLVIGESFDEIEGLPIGISNINFENIAINIKGTSDNYRPLIKTDSEVCVTTNNVSVTGGFFAGPIWSKAALIKLSLNNSAFKDVQLITDGNFDQSPEKVAVVEIGSKVTLDNTTLGSATKIFATDF